ncbi:MAG TPA: lysine--tRNA ligase, partial [Stellaceae bacterium]|nr:lysine--tRNA ligase [Stellaceae bacterium]
MADNEVGEDALRAVRLEKLGELKKLGLEAYPYSFAVTASAAELAKRYESLPAKTETQDQVAIAGRIRSIRNSGMFIDLHDASGKIQVFSH